MQPQDVLSMAAHAETSAWSHKHAGNIMHEFCLPPTLQMTGGSVLNVTNGRAFVASVTKLAKLEVTAPGGKRVPME